MGFTLGTKTKEAPKLNTTIGQEYDLEPKDFTLGSETKETSKPNVTIGWE